MRCSRQINDPTKGPAGATDVFHNFGHRHVAEFRLVRDVLKWHMCGCIASRRACGAVEYPTENISLMCAEDGAARGAEKVRNIDKATYSLAIYGQIGVLMLNGGSATAADHHSIFCSLPSVHAVPGKNCNQSPHLRTRYGFFYFTVRSACVLEANLFRGAVVQSNI